MRQSHWKLILVLTSVFCFTNSSSAQTQSPILNPANGHYYELVTGYRSWTAAKAEAESRAFQGQPGHLATITSAQENQFVSQRFQSSTIFLLWIGGFQNGNPSDPAANWQWVTGEPWGYTNWFTGEPNDSAQPENYLEMTGTSTGAGNGTWNDVFDNPVGRNQGYIIEYEPGATTSWVQATPTGAPPPRTQHSTIYDPGTDQIIIFGGQDQAGNRNDLWRLTNANGTNPQWIQVNPIGTNPAPRIVHAASYDATNDRMIVFGGGLGGTAPCTSEVWVLTNATGVRGTPSWVQLTPAGNPLASRLSHSQVYDPTTNRLIVFGGNDCFANFFGDVWVLTNANGLGGTPTWSQISPATPRPSARRSHSAVYDALSNRMIVFGGFDGQSRNDVWILTNANGVGGTPAWIQLPVTAQAAAPRSDHEAIYDSATNRMLIYGGHAATTFSDVWALSNANGLTGASIWTPLEICSDIPPDRSGHSMVFDAGSRTITIFGGQNAFTSNYLNDTWKLKLNCPNVTIGPTTIANGTVGTPYSQTFTATGGGTVTTLSLVGTLPAGLAFVNGVLSGTPRQTGTFDFLVKTLDPGGCVSCRSFTLVVTGVPLARLTLNGGFDFGPLIPVRTPPANPPSQTFSIENAGSAPLLLTFTSILRTGSDVDGQKITNADDRNLYSLRAINANGIETPIGIGSASTIGIGQSQRFRVLYNPVMPLVGNSTRGLSASQVLQDTNTSTLTISQNGGDPLRVSLIGRINPTVQMLTPVIFRRDGSDIVVEASVHDPNFNTYLIRFQFLDSAGRNVGLANDVEIRDALRTSTIVKGQSFLVEQRFPGAASNQSLTSVRVTAYDGEGDSSATSGTATQAVNALAIVSAASYSEFGLAGETIASAFGSQLATMTVGGNSHPLPTSLGGTTVLVKDSLGTERLASLFYVSPTQVNYLLPAETKPGLATVTITSGDGKVAIGTTHVAWIAPSLFSANSDGQGVAAAAIQRVVGEDTQRIEAVATFDSAQKKFVAVPINLGVASEQVYLILFGTGIRHCASLAAVQASIGGVAVPVAYAGAQGQYAGLDQVNLLLPRSLVGHGEVEVKLMVEGQAANTVKIHIK